MDPVILCFAQFEQMLGLAQRSQDELFHIALYNWLIQADLTDKLLEVNSPFLEEHLMHMIKQDQSKVRNMDLLWRYYEKSRSFGKAAHVLARLADMYRFGTISYVDHLNRVLN